MDGSGTRSLSETNEGDESESNKSTAQRGRMLPSLIIHSFGYIFGEMNPPPFLIVWVCRVDATKESMEG